MATINYKCDTCKREIELIENKTGLTTLSGCTITKNCRGNLYKLKRNPNNVRQNIPKYDADLEDYTQRKLLHIHHQEIASSRWVVKHGFGPSCVYVVYDQDGNIVPPDEYSVDNVNGISTVSLSSSIIGSLHVISRTGGLSTLEMSPSIVMPIQISTQNIITFAIPKYITRINSGSSPILPPAVVPVTPTPSPTSLPDPAPYEICSNTIKIEIEVTKPNEPTVACTETLDSLISNKSPWFGWNRILIRNRKHYCIKTIDFTKLKVFSNTNNNKIIIPDGTILKIKRIDYGTGLLVNIPDRGLLVLLTNPPYDSSDKNLDNIIDCGEMVNSDISWFEFKDMKLFCDESIVEKTFPSIKKYSI